MSQRSGMVSLPQALLADLIRRYWVLGIECSMLEVHHLAWLLVRQCQYRQLLDPLGTGFQARRYGPYADDALGVILAEVAGGLLGCEGDTITSDVAVVWFDESRDVELEARLAMVDAEPYRQAIDAVDQLIDGFQSPLGMEVLATLDWLISQEQIESTVEAIKEGLRHWPDDLSGQRKRRLFSDRLIALALERLTGETIPSLTLAAER